MNATGLVTWTPTAADVGTLSIVVKATDSAGLSDSQAFNVGVGGVQASNAPEFVSIPATSALEGKTYNYQAVAVDADNSAAKFTYTLTSTASGNLALSTDGALTWKPTSKERGTVSITIQAKEDDGEIATQSFNVTVGPTPSSGSSGCGCHVGETEPAANGWMFGAVVMVGFLWQRRRSRQRQ
jgi:MYXO-CTERM domain-containing protein